VSIVDTQTKGLVGMTRRNTQTASLKELPVDVEFRLVFPALGVRRIHAIPFGCVVVSRVEDIRSREGSGTPTSA
jgi:hypothetical protein